MRSHRRYNYLKARCMLQRVIRMRANASVLQKTYIQSINNHNK